MKASKSAWAGAIILALCPLGTKAQQASQSSTSATNPQTTQKSPEKPKPAAKSTKVWTEDDISSVRTPADDYMDVVRAQTAASAAAANQPKPAGTNAAKPDQPPLLSNPKTVDSADKMIAWEQRDIDSQQEYLQKLQSQLATAPDDQKAHIQAWIDQEIKTIADTKKEQAGLVAQKKDLEKKAAAASDGSKQPQSQQ